MEMLLIIGKYLSFSSYVLHNKCRRILSLFPKNSFHRVLRGKKIAVGMEVGSLRGLGVGDCVARLKSRRNRVLALPVDPDSVFHLELALRTFRIEEIVVVGTAGDSRCNDICFPKALDGFGCRPL